MLERVGAAIAAVLLCAILGAWGMHSYMADKLQLAEDQRDALGDQVREQNRAVESLRDAEKARKAAADARVAAADATARQAELSAQRLLSLARPAGVDECAAASALIARELKK